MLVNFKQKTDYIRIFNLANPNIWLSPCGSGINRLGLKAYRFMITGCICLVWFSTLYLLAAEFWLFRSFISQIIHHFNPSPNMAIIRPAFPDPPTEAPRNHEADLTQADPPKRPGAQRSGWKNSSEGKTVEVRTSWAVHHTSWSTENYWKLLKLVIRAFSHWWISMNAAECSSCKQCPWLINRHCNPRMWWHLLKTMGVITKRRSLNSGIYHQIWRVSWTLAQIGSRNLTG